MLSVLEEKGGITLLDGTGVTEGDLLNIILDFGQWASRSKGSSLLKFFKKLPPRKQQVLALIGTKYMADEYARMIKEEQKNDTENTGDRS